MLTQHTLTQLKALKLDGMARAFDEQLTQPAAASLAFEERFGMLVDRASAAHPTTRTAGPWTRAIVVFTDGHGIDVRAKRGAQTMAMA